MTDVEFRLARRLYESLDYDIKVRFYHFAQSHHKPGCPYPGGWLDAVKYLCECHNRNIHVERPEQGGEWLSENVKHEGHRFGSQDVTPALSEIGVSKNESSNKHRITNKKR